MTEIVKESRSVCIPQFLTLHDGSLYHKETSPLICSTNQWPGFYVIETSFMKELRKQVCLQAF